MSENNEPYFDLESANEDCHGCEECNECIREAVEIARYQEQEKKKLEAA